MTDDRTMTAHEDCEAVDAWLSAFVDDAASGDERAAVARHLDRCARCRGVVRDYRALGPALRAAVGSAAARDLSAITWPRAVSARLVLTPRRRLLYDVARWGTPWQVVAGAAALVALVVGISFWRPPAAVLSVEIDRLDADGPVMVLTASDGRSVIIWLSEPEAPAASAPAVI